MKSSRPLSAFTLVELLVVLGIITLMSGLLGWALREGDHARGLESAQATVASLLIRARDQAVLNQTRSQLVIEADPATDSFLRRLHVAVESAPNSDLWQIAESGAVFPPGVYIVPGIGNVPGVIFAPKELPSVWPGTRYSSLVELPVESVAPEGDIPSGVFLGMRVPLTAAGRPGSGGGDKFVLTLARRTPTGVIFEQPDQVRGIALSSYGMAIFINEAPGFDF